MQTGTDATAGAGPTFPRTPWEWSSSRSIICRAESSPFVESFRQDFDIAREPGPAIFPALASRD